MMRIFRLYHEVQKQDYGNDDDDTIITEKLNKLSTEFPEHIRMQMVNGQRVIALCTPLMRRVHEFWPRSAEMMFMDSSGNFDREQYRVFALLSQSYVGGLPLGIIITATESGDALSTGLKLLLELIDPKKAFYGNGQPNIVMTDNSAAEQKALGTVFPGVKLLLCTFHILQAIWRYILNGKNSVPNNERSEVYLKFKKMVELRTEMNKAYKVLIDTTNNPKIKEYATDLFKQKEDWAFCYRKDDILRGSNTNNISEATMRILKEKIFNRKRSYNIVQLVDFLLTRIDCYYEQRLLDVCAEKDMMMRKRYQMTTNKEKNCRSNHHQCRR